MKRLLIKYALFTLCLLPFSSYAIDGWYGSIGAGTSTTNTSKFSFDDNIVYKIKSSVGIVGNLAAGYSFDNPIRLEVELGMVYQNFKDLRFDKESVVYSDSLDGHINSTLGMVNAYFQFNKKGIINPYVGFGGGASHCNFKLESDIITPGPEVIPVEYESKKATTAFQGIVGCEYSISPYTGVAFEYRFLKLTPFKVKSLDEKGEVNFSKHLFLISLTQSF